MRTTFITLGGSLILAATQIAAIVTLDDREMTYYYDMTAPKGDGGLCFKNGAQMAEWNDVTYIWFDGLPRRPACSKDMDQTYISMKTNRIVSIPAGLLASDESLCGKEVKVYSPQGEELKFDEGPLFVYDSCEKCNITNAVDFSVKAFAQMCGGQCGIRSNGVLNYPAGWKVEITDKTVWPEAGSA